MASEEAKGIGSWFAHLALDEIWYESDITGTHATDKLDEVRTAIVRFSPSGR